jgi:UPF0176 protein
MTRFDAPTEREPVPFAVAAFYRFVPLEDVEALRSDILAFCKAQGVKGTLLLAPEGINATVAGEREAVGALMEFLRAYPAFAGLERKESFSAFQPFKKMKVRLKSEIVRMDEGALDPAKTGVYVDSEAWDAVLADPDTVVIDARNEYETRIGAFRGALLPKTRHFRDFPAWAKGWAKSADRQTRVAMYCTGGIRCEKSTAFMKGLGFENVLHLKGGILQYLEDTGNESGAWTGACFVFDDRAAVDAHLAPSEDVRCSGCGAKASADSLKHGREGEILCDGCL